MAREANGDDLRVEGLDLLESRLPWKRKEGEELLDRVLRDHADDLWAVAGAHSHLADHYEAQGDVDRAVHHHRACLEAEQRAGNISHDTELKLAALLVATGEAAAGDEADRLLARRLGRGVAKSAEKWRYCVTRARLARLRGHADEAAFFARVALNVLARNEPVYARHPDIGLVDAGRGEIREVQRLAAGGHAEAYDERVERYRRPHGGVEWDWSLVERVARPAGARERLETLEAEAGAVVDDLRAAGFEVYDFFDWAQRKLPSAGAVRRAAAVLVPWLDRPVSPDLKATIARALRDTRARKLATGPLLRLFAELVGGDVDGEGPPPTAEAGARRRLKAAVGDALATLARDEHLDDVQRLVRDPRHGSYRACLFWALDYMKCPAAVDLAIDMLDDEQVGMVALHTLGTLRSERAEPVLRRIADEPRPRGRSDAAERARTRVDVARKGLEKLERARAQGKARP